LTVSIGNQTIALNIDARLFVHWYWNSIFIDYKFWAPFG